MAFVEEELIKGKGKDQLQSFCALLSQTESHFHSNETYAVFLLCWI